jgi:hypothetical protein
MLEGGIEARTQPAAGSKQCLKKAHLDHVGLEGKQQAARGAGGEQERVERHPRDDHLGKGGDAGQRHALGDRVDGALVYVSQEKRVGLFQR